MNSMSREEKIRKILSENIQTDFLELINESSRHRAREGMETHFRLRLVSREFEGQSLVLRHRRVYDLLGTELNTGLHALSIEAYTPVEWEARQMQGASSPPCAHR